MATKACWGIDVGQCALKAIKLRQSGGEVEAIGFDVIEHAKILSQPDADEQQLIRNALEKFLSRNDVRGDIIVVGVPGQASFSRFIKLPPVELKKVPEIVKYEARQQIPFNLDEVIWDYQTLTMPTGGPVEVEVGIFAMKRDIVQDYVNDFTRVKIVPDLVQMGPVALYNYLRHDRRDGAGATLLIDVGAENTSLVIADGYRVWIRNFPLGGNNFTQALVKAFKLTFGKAENLKRHAGESKYAKEVFQAMRPVFSDLLTEIQRSIGFYTSLHRESRIERVLAMGNSFRLPGLQKYLTQNLGVEVSPVQQFSNLRGEHVLGAPMFKDNVLSFGVAYGLALQGLGLGTITTSLLPPEILKEKELRRKRPFVAAAAAAVVIGCALFAYGARESNLAIIDVAQQGIGNIDSPDKAKGVLEAVAQLDKRSAEAKKNFDAEKSRLQDKQRDIDRYLDLMDVPSSCPYRELWFSVLREVWDALPKDGRVDSYDPTTDQPPWSSLKLVEVLKIRAEYKEVSEATGKPLEGAGATTMSGAEQRGTPILVFYLEGSMPCPSTGDGATLLRENLINRLSQRKLLQSVRQLGGGYYKKASGYPYEAEKPKPKEEAKPEDGGTATEPGLPLGPAGVDVPRRPSEKKAEEKEARVPWRGDDYWFQIHWHVNLADPRKPVLYLGESGQGSAEGTGLPPGPTP